MNTDPTVINAFLFSKKVGCFDSSSSVSLEARLEEGWIDSFRKVTLASRLRRPLCKEQSPQELILVGMLFVKPSTKEKDISGRRHTEIAGLNLELDISGRAIVESGARPLLATKSLRNLKKQFNFLIFGSETLDNKTFSKKWKWCHKLY